MSICMFSCKSQQHKLQNQKRLTQNTVLENPETDFSLSRMLSRIAGVHVRGRGANAIIRVRGGSGSFVSSNQPLFLLNEQIVQGGYATLVNSIDPTQIKNIEVLKDIGSLSSFGSRGANGVIKITLK